MSGAKNIALTGRCFCRDIRFEARAEPLSVCVCHCSDCRRATGGPTVAVAAFSTEDAVFSPGAASYVSPASGAERTFCGTCGSSLAFRGDYVPGQVFVHLGILDEPQRLEPDVESFSAERLGWLHVDASVDRFPGTSRARLNTGRSRADSAGIGAEGVLERCG